MKKQSIVHNEIQKPALEMAKKALINVRIRKKFRDLIDEWKSNLVLKTHKFKEYNLE